MELLRGTAPKVEFDLPTADAAGVSATYSMDGASPQNTIVSVANGVASAQLPYLPEEGTMKVVWTFTIPGVGSGTFNETEIYDIVTPYLPIKEIVAMGVSTEDAKKVESAVRHVINAHTGQSFGHEKNKTYTIEGHGDTAVRLPKRLIEIKGLATLTEVLDHKATIITSDGWYLKKSWANSRPRVDASDSTYWGDISGNGVFNNTTYKDHDDSYNPGYETVALPGGGSASVLNDPTITPVTSRPAAVTTSRTGEVFTGGVTVAPTASGGATKWKSDYPFEITGDWGYERVPEPVREAARLLVNDYACSEQLYRDRYLESIKAADWRLQFSTRAWDHTGNARADHLLAEFVLMDWWVI